MNATFQPDDLRDLDELLDRAFQVVAMCDVFDGNRDPRVIGMRHDVDNVIEPAVAFAEWEAARGYRSSYYVLHTAPYWRDETLLRRSLERIVECGHEVGIHNNALAESSTTGEEPQVILARAIAELRGWGFEIRGTVGHGDKRCYGPDGKLRFANDEIFRECDRGRNHAVCSLSDFGLVYDAIWLKRGAYLSDSGGYWSEPGFDFTVAGFPFDGQLHLLLHPCWWRQALERDAVAA